MQQSPTAAGMVTIPYGETSATFTVAILTDSETEIAETFTITLSSPSANAGLGATTAATFTIYAQFAPEDVLDTLNPLSAKIDALLGPETETAPYPLEYFESAIYTALEVMQSELDDLLNSANANEFDANLRAYDSSRAVMVEILNAVLDVANEIIETGRQAAAASQGQKIRIFGIGADLNLLNGRLGEIQEVLINQQEQLLFIYGTFTLTAIQTSHLDTVWDSMEAQVDRITICAGRANAVVPAALANVENDATLQEVLDLNETYDAILSLYVDVVLTHDDVIYYDGLMTALHEDIRNAVGNAEWTYEGLVLAFGYRIDANCYDIAGEVEDPEDDPFSVVDLLIDAKDHFIPGDAWAQKGTASWTQHFDSIIVLEGDMVLVQWAEMVDISATVYVAPSVFQNLEDLADELLAARSRLASV